MCSKTVVFHTIYKNDKNLGQNALTFNPLAQMESFKTHGSCLLIVRVHPDNDDGDKADRDEENVEAKQQAVYDEAHLHPLL